MIDALQKLPPELRNHQLVTPVLNAAGLEIFARLSLPVATLQVHQVPGQHNDIFWLHWNKVSEQAGITPEDCTQVVVL
jgi:hypothetical protein